MPKTKTEKPISKAKKPKKKTKYYCKKCKRYFKSPAGLASHTRSSIHKQPKKKIKIKTPENVNDIESIGRYKHHFTFVGKDGKNYSLSEKQKLFVEKYLEFKGNGVDAVIEAGYDVFKKDKKGNPLYPNRKMAAVVSAQNLVKLNIIAYKNLLLEEYGFTSEAVHEQHLFLINQDANLSAKSKGVDMFYKLKGSYAPEKHEHTIKDKLDELTPEELKAVVESGKLPGKEDLT